MAVKWQDQAEFITQNAKIAHSKLQSPQNIMLGNSPPSFITYYHINTHESTVDKGVQGVEMLYGKGSGNKFNRIKNVPVWELERMDANVDDDEAGLDVSIDGSFKIPPNMFHPFPDDYFTIDSMERPLIFKVTAVNYDTPNARGFFRVEFELFCADQNSIDALNESVTRDYSCIFDHIGTVNKAVVADDEYSTMHEIHELQVQMRDEYLEKFRDQAYNALMFNRTSYNQYLYDPTLNSFCNKEKVFDTELFGDARCFLLYEENRNFQNVEYEDSIYDRLTHRDLTDLNEVCCYYDMEPVENDISIFDFYKDRRVKYLMAYAKPKGPFGNELQEYLSKTFLSSLKLRNSKMLDNAYEKFVWQYMVNGPDAARNYIEEVSQRRIKYNFHSFIFVPMVLYVLKQIYNHIVCDTGIMDEMLLTQYSINKKGGNT